ncbi:MAG: UDP-N-acetylglucosamine 2-epimerase (non-hydrolyzing) [Myxococcota bacterium]|nr:UDP-N-acetylglucosamine 2-epimerase (non-hydrolyzing) [Myxococcota bacterium]
MKVLSVFGTRPEAIKMAPVVKALSAADDMESVVCVTAQHRDMLDQVLGIFNIVPDEDLDLMTPGQSLHALTARVLVGMQTVLERHQPDVVLVHGDTTTTLATALAAFYAQIPVGHVEAGLRTGDMSAPFPEEANRVLADRICHFYFPPTQRSADNLLAEGLPADRIWNTGNTVIDALFWVRDAMKDTTFSPEIYGSASPFIQEKNTQILLVTGHRRESFGGGFERICQALSNLAQRYPSLQIVYPVHLNPKVQEPVHRHLSHFDNIHLIRPLEYPDFVRLMDRAHIILTDSGGIQEEAPALDKPTLVMRDVTERPEGIAAGVVKLVGTQSSTITEAVSNLLDHPNAYAQMQQAVNPYGDGQASIRIVDALRGVSL